MYISKYPLAIMLLVFLLHFMLFAESVEQENILKAADSWIAQNTVFMEGNTEAIPSKATQLTASDGTALPLWLVDLSPTGYIIMGADDTLPPVVAFNANAPYSSTTPPLPEMLSRQGEIFQEVLNTPQTRGNDVATANQSRWQALLQPTRADSITPAVIIRQPMLSTTWNQDYPYNLLAPRSPDGSPAWAGCVPVAMAQLLKYHEWPPAGTEIVSSTDTDGDVTASLQADLSVPYEWELMRDNYDGKETALEALPIARLLFEAGVLLKANYGLDGTSALSKNISLSLIQKLKYASANYDYSNNVNIAQTKFYGKIREDMVIGRPCAVSYQVPDNPGHGFIADGLGISFGLDYYHFNYGWGGHHHGWYLLTDGYDKSVIDDATTNIQPEPIPVFRPMSFEQPSSFTLSWDFPKRLTAEAFTLSVTPQDSTRSSLSFNLSGTARSYTIWGQSGTNTYTLSAMVNGNWQAVSDGLTITVKENPTPMPTLTLESELSCLAGGLTTTTISSNNTLANLTVISSRPDILPDSAIVVSGSGKSRTIKLMPSSGSIGNLLLYVTAQDTAGNIVRKTALLSILENHSSSGWHTSLAKAVEEARNNQKLILLVAGNGDGTTNNFTNAICETSEIKAELLENYTLWYCDTKTSSEHSVFTKGLGNNFPLCAIIAPDDLSKRLRGKGGSMTIEETKLFLDKHSVFFNLNPAMTFDRGQSYPLELSYLDRDAVIHYRLDTLTPINFDPIADDVIMLTDTVTITARAFKNDTPIGDALSRTYTFSGWNTSLANAVAEAKADQKLILLVAGNEDSDTNFFKDTICETSDIKAELLENYTLWYCNYYASDEHSLFTQNLGNLFPLCAIIDPVDISKRIRGRGGSMTVTETKLFLDKHSLFFNLNPAMTFERSQTYPLELSCLDRDVIIHYRLDATTPTNDDPIADNLILLTDTVTITARAFKNASPIADAISKTYAFTGWNTSLDNAVAEAKNNHTLILLVTGNEDTATNNFKNTIYETSDIKAELLENYTLWYCNYFESDEHNVFTQGLGDNFPLCAIIDPDDLSRRLRGKGGSMSVAETKLFLDKHSVYFNLNPAMTFERGQAYPLELSCLDRNAVIHYRLDATTPTNNDPIVDDVILLTDTITIAACAFKNGSPITDELINTYSFTGKMPPPVLDKLPIDYFIDSCTLKATCATSGAVIRYTTDKYAYPTDESPVFPEEGLMVTEYTFVRVSAFKEGVIQSDYVQCELFPAYELDNANDIVSGSNNMTFFTTGTPWFVEEKTYLSAPNAVQSGTIKDNESTALIARVNGEGTIQFSWKASTEDYFDILSFYIDDELQTSISGKTEWKEMNIDVIGKGKHLLRWIYTKDAFNFDNDDCAWVDDITWTQGSKTDMTFKLVPGWNLIGTPLKLNEASIKLLKSFHPLEYAAESQTFQRAIHDYVPGSAFWIFSKKTTNLVLSGMLVENYKQKLYRGWNLITPLYGWNNSDELTINLAPVWYWDSSGYKPLLPTKNVLPGIGYWIYSDKERIIGEE